MGALKYGTMKIGINDVQWQVIVQAWWGDKSERTTKNTRIVKIKRNAHIMLC